MRNEDHLIAPCGMNCELCIGYIREKKPCSGCNKPDNNKPYHCTVCRLKLCEEHNNRSTRFCYDCHKFPCARLRQLDKRYRTRYGMSMIENLNYIKEHGLKSFIAAEKSRWTCKSCGEMLSAHRGRCLSCESVNPHFPV